MPPVRDERSCCFENALAVASEASGIKKVEDIENALGLRLLSNTRWVGA